MRSPRTPVARSLRRALLSLLIAGSACALSEGGRVPAAQAQPAWFPITPSNAGPVIRRQSGMIIDEAGNRMVVAGGEFTDNRTWALDLAGEPVWTLLNENVPGTAADIVRAVYDSNQRRMILVTWDLSVHALDLADPQVWTALIGGGAAGGPTPRRYPVVVYDSFRNRLVIFGGGPDSGIWADVWALNLSGVPVWTNITPAVAGPVARWAAVGVYDPIGDRLIVGTGDGGGIRSDFWELPLSAGGAWAPITTIGPAPGARYLSAATYDPVNRELLLYGGNNGSVGLGDLWGLPLDNPQGWIPYSPLPPVPAARWSHAVAVHAGRANLHTFSGWDGSQYRSDLWGMPRPNASIPPVIFSFTPPGGRIGDEVVINGTNLMDPQEVTIGGVAASVVAANFTTIRAVVPPGAQTGPITVTTASGTGVSEESFFVGELAELTEVFPDSGRWGEVVQLRGRHLTTTSKVAFGGLGSAPFVVHSDTVLSVTLDTLAASGHIRVTTLVGTALSPFEFLVIPDDPRPRLLSVRDVANDQGGRVMLRWRASDFDRLRYRSITGYRVWRRAPLEGLTSALAAANGWKSNRELGQAAGPPAFWENLAELPAAFLPGYAYAAATLSDSTELGNPYTAYFVQAITADPFTFYNSSPDSGYSIDNLSPPAPSPLAVNYGPSANTLHWRGRELRDLRGYELHRGTSADFVPSAANLIATTTDTSYVDLAGSSFYKLAAADFHGNRSRYVAVSPDRPVATIASFFRSFRERGLARVIWYSGGNPNLFANVYRRTETSDWERVGGVLADGRGYLTYEDRAVTDGVRYGYRLGILEPEAFEALMGEAWVEPLAEAFAFTGRIPNPSAGGRISCAIVVPVGERADLRLFDISGRELERQSVEPGAGERTVEFGAARRLRAGVYLLRATSGRAVMTRRVVVLD